MKMRSFGTISSATVLCCTFYKQQISIKRRKNKYFTFRNLELFVTLITSETTNSTIELSNKKQPYIQWLGIVGVNLGLSVKVIFIITFFFFRVVLHDNDFSSVLYSLC